MYEICIWTNKPIIKEVVDHATSLEEAKSIIKGLSKIIQQTSLRDGEQNVLHPFLVWCSIAKYRIETDIVHELFRLCS